MKVLPIIFTAILFVSCSSNVYFSSQCDARLGYGLNGPVESVEYEEIFSEREVYLRPIGRFDISTQPRAICKFNKSGNIVEKYESNGKSDFIEAIKYDHNGRVKHREIDGAYTDYIDIDYESVSDTLILATYKSRDLTTKVKVRYDANGNFLSYETENGYIERNNRHYNPWLFRIASSGEFLSESGHSALFVSRSSGNKEIITREYWFDQGESGIYVELRDEYDANSQLSKAIVIGGSVGYEWVDAGFLDTNERVIKYNHDAPITVAEYHYDNSLPNLETACTFTDKNDRGTFNIAYAYEYDQYNNWVSRLTYTNGKLDRIEKRIIKYYGGPKTKSSNEYIAQAQQVIIEQKLSETQQRLEILRNPIVLQPYVCEFYDNTDDHFHIGVQDIVSFRFKADAINRSDRTFIDIKCYDAHDTGNVNLFGNPRTEKTNKSYVALYFNKNFIIRDGRWAEPVHVSFNDAWKPQETKTLEIDITPWDDTSITLGHAQFVPKQALLHIEFVLEDIDGKRTTVTFEYDIKEIWHDFANSVNKK